MSMTFAKIGLMAVVTADMLFPMTTAIMTAMLDGLRVAP